MLAVMDKDLASCSSNSTKTSIDCEESSKIIADELKATTAVETLLADILYAVSENVEASVTSNGDISSLNFQRNSEVEHNKETEHSEQTLNHLDPSRRSCTLPLPKRLRNILPRPELPSLVSGDQKLPNLINEIGPNFSELTPHSENKSNTGIYRSLDLSSKTSEKNIDSSLFKYRCVTCGKRFQTFSHVYSHACVHTGEKPFICDICGKAFKGKGYLQIHMAKHNEQTIHGCDFCPATFWQKGNLRVHIKNVHAINGAKIFKCKHCACVFKSISSRTSHIEHAHGQQENTVINSTKSTNQNAEESTDPLKKNNHLIIQEQMDSVPNHLLDMTNQVEESRTKNEDTPNETHPRNANAFIWQEAVESSDLTNRPHVETQNNENFAIMPITLQQNVNIRPSPQIQNNPMLCSSFIPASKTLPNKSSNNFNFVPVIQEPPHNLVQKGISHYPLATLNSFNHQHSVSNNNATFSAPSQREITPLNCHQQIALETPNILPFLGESTFRNEIIEIPTEINNNHVSNFQMSNETSFSSLSCEETRQSYMSDLSSSDNSHSQPNNTLNNLVSSRRSPTLPLPRFRKLLPRPPGVPSFVFVPFMDAAKVSEAMKDFWSKEDDQKLLKLVKEIGPNFPELIRHFENKSSETIRKRYNLLKRKHHWTLQEDELILYYLNSKKEFDDDFYKLFPDRMDTAINGRISKLTLDCKKSKKCYTPVRRKRRRACKQRVFSYNDSTRNWYKFPSLCFNTIAMIPFSKCKDLTSIQMFELEEKARKSMKCNIPSSDSDSSSSDSYISDSTNSEELTDFEESENSQEITNILSKMKTPPKWKDSEDTILKQSHKLWGNNWPMLRTFLRPRTISDIKARLLFLSTPQENDVQSTEGSSGPGSVTKDFKFSEEHTEKLEHSSAQGRNEFSCLIKPQAIKQEKPDSETEEADLHDFHIHDDNSSKIKTEPLAIKTEPQVNNCEFVNDIDWSIDKFPDITNEYILPDKTVVDESCSSNSTIFIPEECVQYPMETDKINSSLKNMSPSVTVPAKNVVREKELSAASDKLVHDFLATCDKKLSPEIVILHQDIQDRNRSSQLCSMTCDIQSTTVCTNEVTENQDPSGFPVAITDIVSLSKEPNICNEKGDYLHEESFKSSEKGFSGPGGVTKDFKFSEGNTEKLEHSSEQGRNEFSCLLKPQAIKQEKPDNETEAAYLCDFHIHDDNSSKIKKEPLAIKNEPQVNNCEFANDIDWSIDKFPDIINECILPAETVVNESCSSTSTIFIAEKCVQYPNNINTNLKNISPSVPAKIVAKEKELSAASDELVHNFFAACDKKLSPEIVIPHQDIPDINHTSQPSSMICDIKSTTVCANEITENQDPPGFPVAITDVVSLSKESDICNEKGDYLHKESFKSSKKDDQKLLNLTNEIGPNFSELTHHFENKSSTNISRSLDLSNKTYRKNINRSSFKYDCLTCGERFQTVSPLIEHLSIHKGERQFRCDLCESAFEEIGALQIHMAEHNGQKPHDCNFCPATFSQRGNLRAHIQKVHNAGVFKCEQCACVFKSMASRNSHLRCAHGQQDKIVINSTKSISQNEGESTDPLKKSNLIVQEQMNHLLDMMNQVDESRKTNKDASKETDPNNANTFILKHSLENSGLTNKKVEIKVEPEDETLPQTIVASVVDAATGKVNRHFVRKVGNELWGQCIYCDKEFKKINDLVHHIRVHANDKPYKCTQCFREFSVKSTLKAHEQAHLGFKQYKCDICLKMFFSPVSLKVHKLLHTGIKSYACHICGKNCRTFGQRISHLYSYHKVYYSLKYKYKRVPKLKESNIQEKNIALPDPILITDKGLVEKPASKNVSITKKLFPSRKRYCCYICYKAYRKLKVLRQHIRSHAAENPFQCSECQRCFMSNDVLKRHLETHTDIKPFKCKLCDTSFVANCSLKRHLLIHSYNRLYVCPYCQKSYKTSIDCREHINSHHRELEQSANVGVSATILSDGQTYPIKEEVMENTEPEFLLPDIDNSVAVKTEIPTDVLTKQENGPILTPYVATQSNVNLTIMPTPLQQNMNILPTPQIQNHPMLCSSFTPASEILPNKRSNNFSFVPIMPAPPSNFVQTGISQPHCSPASSNSSNYQYIISNNNAIATFSTPLQREITTLNCHQQIALKTPNILPFLTQSTSHVEIIKTPTEINNNHISTFQTNNENPFSSLSREHNRQPYMPILLNNHNSTPASHSQPNNMFNSSVHKKRGRPRKQPVFSSNLKMSKSLFSRDTFSKCIISPSNQMVNSVPHVTTQSNVNLTIMPTPLQQNVNILPSPQIQNHQLVNYFIIPPSQTLSSARSNNFVLVPIVNP